MYSYIIFDVDGTILDSQRSINEGLARAAREITGREIPMSLAVEAFPMHSEAALRHVGVPEEEMERGLLLFGKYSYCPDTSSAPFPGVVELLEELRRREVPMSVFSARSEDEFDHDPAFRPLCRYFRKLMGTLYSVVPKPAPDGLLRCLREEGLRGSEVLMVGDSPSDSRSAAGAGLAFALAGWNSAVDPAAVPHDYLLQTPKELLTLIN